ncbi:MULTISPECIES: universal stress protein [unclassified Streptomyces]|uniref:universal stress protein n=1 Tax=unclassified Streptomyces TaxID=2593676 RepID=UPI001F04B538|nr:MULTISPECIES: universal stress protein [unclassified Streptomyces]MCH0565707.1 universal stress protein [Streptomyces sp. MUM 2J]MCH0570612.1 universal stress protein [Streptomyces sp. MUM 136J]
MTTILPLVVGVDGSPGSLTAVDWAVDEAARHGAPLRLVHGTHDAHHTRVTRTADPARHGRADRIVALAAERARRRNPSVDVSTDVVPADPVDALLSAGDHASALVTGARGLGEAAGLLLGSVGLAVASRARCPVVVVRGDPAGLAGRHDRILLGAGEPAGGGAAVRFAFREAEARGCELDAVRAWRRPARDGGDHGRPAGAPDRPHEEEARARLDDLLGPVAAEHPGVRVRRTAVQGPARKVLVQRSAAADLVVVGAHRRPGALGPRLGRVAHTLLHHAEAPVAVIPQEP